MEKSNNILSVKLYFPTGYNVEDIYDEVLDVHIILDNKHVYFGAFFTLKRIQGLMSEMDEKYESDYLGGLFFWEEDMVIVENMALETIKKVTRYIVKDELYERMFSRIGDVDSIYEDSDALSRAIIVTI